MMFAIKKQFVLFAALSTLGLSACSTTSENDSSLESEDPVEAAESESVASPATAPEARPVNSVALPSEPAAMPAASAVPARSGSMMNTSRRVMYVKVDGAVLREKAEPKANVVGKLEKGDHLLVTIDGDWAKTDDGKFISTKVLSEKGIGRGKKGAAWSGGKPAVTSGTAAPAKSDVKKSDVKAAVKSSDKKVAPPSSAPAATEEQP